MSLEITDLVEIVETCLRDVAAEEGFELPSLEGGTELFGEVGILDSMALVSLVTAVEEAIDQKAGVTISLADERAMSQSKSPFRTIDSLAEYSLLRINDEQLDG